MMTWRWQGLWMAIWLLIGAGAQALAPGSLSYAVRTAAGTAVHVVSVDLTDPAVQVVPQLAYGTPGRAQSFAGFLNTYHPLAQITGGYFSLSDWQPIGEIVIHGAVRTWGYIGSALAIRPDGTAEIVDMPRGFHSAWSGYEQVLRGGIRLVRDRQVALSPYEQGFRDPALFGNASRTAVGVTPAQRLLLVATGKGISLTRLAMVMRDLGCAQAMTLDGGTSTGLAYGDRIILAPGRALCHVLTVQARPDPPAPAPVLPVSPPD